MSVIKDSGTTRVYLPISDNCKRKTDNCKLNFPRVATVEESIEVAYASLLRDSGQLSVEFGFVGAACFLVENAEGAWHLGVAKHLR